MTIHQRKDDFQQRLIAAMLPHDPSLESISNILKADGDNPHLEENEEGDMILFPTTDEEFEEVAKMYGLS